MQGHEIVAVAAGVDAAQEILVETIAASSSGFED
jgi:hypothetical protein